MNRNITSVSLYVSGSAAQGLVSFVLLPFLSSELSLEEFALLSLITSISIILQVFIAFNSVSFPMIAYHEKNQELTKLAGNFHSIFLVSMLPITVAMLFFDLFNVIAFFNIGLFILVHASFSILMIFRLSMLQINEKPLPYFICQVVTALTSLYLTYFLISNLSLGLDGRLIGMVGGLFFVLALMYLCDRPRTFLKKISFKTSDLTPTIKYGLSFLLYKLVKQTRGHLDKFITLVLIGMADLAILAMAISVSVPIQLINTAIEKTFTPKILKIMAERDSSPVISKIGPQVLLMTCISAAMSILSYFVIVKLGPIFIDEKFTDAFDLVFWLALGLFILSINSNVMTLYAKLRKGYLLSKLAVVHLINHFFVSVSLVYFFGILGAVVGYCLSYSMSLLINLYFIRTDMLGSKNYAR